MRSGPRERSRACHLAIAATAPARAYWQRRLACAAEPVCQPRFPFISHGANLPAVPGPETELNQRPTSQRQLESEHSLLPCPLLFGCATIVNQTSAHLLHHLTAFQRASLSAADDMISR